MGEPKKADLEYIRGVRDSGKDLYRAYGALWSLSGPGSNLQSAMPPFDLRADPLPALMVKPTKAASPRQLAPRQFRLVSR